MIRIDSKSKVDTSSMVTEPLFAIDDVEYQARMEFTPSEALTYMSLAASSWMAAVDFALRVALGDKGHRALMSCDALTKEQMDAITGTVIRRLVGGADGPKA